MSISDLSSPTISIIIPVYNTGIYLERCVNSILDQSFQDFEIILVDDGSEIETAIKCDQLANRDNRIKVIHRPNSGVSSSRNTGLAYAHGKYIHFADSDDYLGKNFYKDMVDTILSVNCEIVCGNILLENSKGEFIAPAIQHERKVMDKEEAIEELLLCRKVSYSLCDKIFNRKIISGLSFRIDIFHNEDFVFCYEALTLASQIAYIPNAYYYYCNNAESAVRRPFNHKRMTAIDAQQIVHNDIVKNYPKLKNLADSQFLKVIIYMAIQISKSKYNDCKDRLRIRNIIRTNLGTIMNSELASGYKIRALLLSISWRLFGLLN